MEPLLAILGFVLYIIIKTVRAKHLTKEGMDAKARVGAPVRPQNAGGAQSASQYRYGSVSDGGHYDAYARTDAGSVGGVAPRGEAAENRYSSHVDLHASDSHYDEPVLTPLSGLEQAATAARSAEFSPLLFTADDIRNGIIMREILDRPRAFKLRGARQCR